MTGLFPQGTGFSKNIFAVEGDGGSPENPRSQMTGYPLARQLPK
jgi:hypothetical protein